MRALGRRNACAIGSCKRAAHPETPARTPATYALSSGAAEILSPRPVAPHGPPPSFCFRRLRDTHVKPTLPSGRRSGSRIERQEAKQGAPPHDAHSTDVTPDLPPTLTKRPPHDHSSTRPPPNFIMAITQDGGGAGASGSLSVDEETDLALLVSSPGPTTLTFLRTST